MLPGAGAAGFGEREQRGHVAHAQRFLDLHVMAQLERFHHVLDDAEFQADGVGEILPVELAAEVQNLEDQMLDDRFGETGLFQ